MNIIHIRKMSSENNSQILFLAKNIRFLRDGLHLSQEELASNLGVGRDNITSYERGTTPKLITLLRLSKLFSISIEDLSELNLDKCLIFREEDPDIVLKGKIEEYATPGIETIFRQFLEGVDADRAHRKTKGTVTHQEAELDALNDRLKNLISVDRHFFVNRDSPTEVSVRVVMTAPSVPTRISSESERYDKNITFPSSSNSNVDPIGRPKSRPNSKNANLGLHETREKWSEIENSKNDSKDDPLSSYFQPLENDPLVSIPILDIAVAATPSAGFFTPEHIERRGTILLSESMVQRGQQYYAIPVINDSMMPTVYRNDFVIAYESDILSVVDDRIYVVITKSDGVVVKRLKNRIKQHGFIRCKSENKAYPSYNLSGDDILGVYEVICRLSFNMSNESANMYEMISRLEDKIDDLQIKVRPRQ